MVQSCSYGVADASLALEAGSAPDSPQAVSRSGAIRIRPRLGVSGSVWMFARSEPFRSGPIGLRHERKLARDGGEISGERHHSGWRPGQCDVHPGRRPVMRGDPQPSSDPVANKKRSSSQGRANTAGVPDATKAPACVGREPRWLRKEAQATFHSSASSATVPDSYCLVKVQRP